MSCNVIVCLCLSLLAVVCSILEKDNFRSNGMLRGGGNLKVYFFFIVVVVDFELVVGNGMDFFIFLPVVLMAGMGVTWT